MRPQLLTPDQAAAYMGLAPRFLRRLAREGRIACVRTSGTVRERRRPGAGTQAYVKTGRVYFRVADLDAWTLAHLSGPAAGDRLPVPLERKFA